MQEPWPRAAHLRAHRHAAGLSLREVGAHLGIAFSTLARIERGEGQPDGHTRLLLERWMDPTTTQTCPCRRCDPAAHPPSWQAVDQRLALLERRVEQLHAAILMLILPKEVPHGHP